MPNTLSSLARAGIDYIVGVGGAVFGGKTSHGLSLDASGNLNNAFPLVTGMVNGSVVTQTGVTSGAGNVDVYTVPAGKYLMVPRLNVFNTTVGAIILYPEVKSGGTYYRVNVNLSVAASANSALQPIFIYSAGDTVAFNSAAAGINWWMSGLLFDNTSPVKCPRILGLVNGSQTLYTCPVGKIAYGWTGNTAVGIIYHALRVCNGTGGALTYEAWAVPNGGAAGAANKIASASVASNTLANGLADMPALVAGDSVVVGTSAGTAGQVAFMSIFEIDTP